MFSLRVWERALRESFSKYLYVYVVSGKKREQKQLDCNSVRILFAATSCSVMQNRLFAWSRKTGKAKLHPSQDRTHTRNARSIGVSITGAESAQTLKGIKWICNSKRKSDSLRDCVRKQQQSAERSVVTTSHAVRNLHPYWRTGTRMHNTSCIASYLA